MANGGGDRRTEGRTDGRTYGNSPLCSTGHRPFGAAAQKEEEEEEGEGEISPMCKSIDLRPLWGRGPKMDFVLVSFIIKLYSKKNR